MSLCEKITQDGGDYRVVWFGDHAWSACVIWFPAEKVINHESIAHGSVKRSIGRKTGLRHQVWWSVGDVSGPRTDFHISTCK
jgi:hypothetical protein